MPRVTIIADDLTGACDASAPFAAAGLRTYVALDPAELPGADVLALSTASRELPADAARARTATAAALARGSDLVVCKIDSTLRGHPLASLTAVMETLNISNVLVAPAFPAQGRTTRGARMLVGERPLEETEFAGVVPTSDLLTLFSTMRYLSLDAIQDERAPTATELLKAGLVVADAQTDADLQRLAALAIGAGVRLFCGSGGMTRAICAVMTAHRQPTARTATGRVQPVLIVAGSRHIATLQQITALEGTGVGVFEPANWLRAVQALRSGAPAVLSTHELVVDAGRERPVAETLARAVLRVVTSVDLSGLVLTGGEVAAAVCSALGARGIWLAGEVEPGLPFGRLESGPYDGLPVGTKAGGFGGEHGLAVLAAAVAGLSVKH